LRNLSTLFDYVVGTNSIPQTKHCLLISEAQTGKTYETENLRARLWKELNVYPILLKSSDYRDNSNDFLKIPYYIQSKNLVVIIDALDEVQIDLRNEYYDKINKFVDKNKEIPIVLTCRRNYIDEYLFKDFERLSLDELSNQDIEDAAEKNNIYVRDFCKEIDDDQIYDIATNPFFLNLMIDYYASNGKLMSRKMDLCKYVIEKTYKKEKEKSIPEIRNHQAEIDKILKKIAFALQLSGKKELEENELNDGLGLSDEEYEKFCRSEIFAKDDGKFRFSKNIFQIYYVVSVLENKGTDEILDKICYDKIIYPRIRPDWYDVFELILNEMSNDKVRKELLEWTFKNDCDALLYVNPRKIEREFCVATFEQILKKYKNLGITCNPDMDFDFYKRLASFCRHEDSYNLLISEYKSQKSFGPYFALMSYIIYYLKISPIACIDKTVIIEPVFDKVNLLGNIDNQWNDYLYLPFRNKIFQEEEYIDKLIDCKVNAPGRLRIVTIFHLIKESGLFDKYIDYVIGHEKYVHNFSDNQGYSHSVDRTPIYQIFENVNTYDAISKSWNHFPSMYKDNNCSFDKPDIENIPKALLKKSQYLVDEHPDLLDTIMDVWEKLVCNYYLISIGSDMFRHFKDFFREMSEKCKFNKHIDESYKRMCQFPDYNSLAPQESYTPVEEISILLNHDEFISIIKKIFRDGDYRKSLEGMDEKEKSFFKKYIPIFLGAAYNSRIRNYDTTEVGKIINDKDKYDSFVLGCIDNNRILEDANETQRDIIGHFLIEYISKDNLSPNDIEKCLRIVMNLKIQLEPDVIRKYLHYANVQSDCNTISFHDETYCFLNYASEILPRSELECFIENLVKQKSLQMSDDHLLRFCKYIMRNDMYRSYSDVIRIMKRKGPAFAYDLLEFFLNDEELLSLLINDYDKFDPEAQFDILNRLYKVDDYKHWCHGKLLEWRNVNHNKKEKDSFSLLLKLGDESALDECINLLKQDTSNIHNIMFAPSLGYNDIKFLPKLIELLETAINIETNNYPVLQKRVWEALANLSKNNQSNYDMIHEAILELINKDEKYKFLNYPLCQFEKTNPLIEAKTLDIKSAMEEADSFL